MNVQQVLVTPEMASAWLQKNTRNRMLRRRRVNQYADSMLARKWILTSETIKISRLGDLLDGQHRLAAIVRSGVACLMQVSFDEPEESYHVIDTGLPRNISDSYKMDSKTPALLRGWAKIIDHSIPPGTQFQGWQASEIYEKHKEAFEFAISRRPKSQGLGRASIWVCFAAFYEHCPNTATILADDFVTIVPAFQTMAVLRDHVRSLTKKSAFGDGADLELFEKTFACICCAIEGKTMQHISRRAYKGTFPATAFQRERRR